MSSISVISKRYDYDSFDKVTLDGQDDEVEDGQQVVDIESGAKRGKWFNKSRFLITTQDLAFLFCVCFGN